MQDHEFRERLLAEFARFNDALEKIAEGSFRPAQRTAPAGRKDGQPRQKKPGEKSLRGRVTITDAQNAAGWMTVTIGGVDRLKSEDPGAIALLTRAADENLVASITYNEKKFKQYLNRFIETIELEEGTAAAPAAKTAQKDEWDDD